MNVLRALLPGTLTALAVLSGHLAAAQDSAATPVVAPAAAASTATAPAAAPKPKRTAQMEAGEPLADTSQPAAPAGPRDTGSRSAPTAAPKSATPAAADRLDLGSSKVTGNQELPTVMYIVPWKKSDIGDLAGKPMNSLLDEVLAPVDRDVFRREVKYYEAVKAEAAPGPKAEAVPQVEK
jgi:hypothetical protein